MIDPSTDTNSVSGHLPYVFFVDPEVLVALCWQVAVNNDRLLTPPRLSTVDAHLTPVHLDACIDQCLACICIHPSITLFTSQTSFWSPSH
jgi:hypothetical protein